ncbi:MAG: nucleotidyltransferase family protein [Planctomycetota bacterium]
MEILRKGLPYFVSEYGVKRIGLFGSYAKGAQAKDSDIDILVEFERPKGLKFVEFGEYIEKLLGKKTDILTPAGIESIRVERAARDIREHCLCIEG